jgi:hypothetical protein
MSLVTLCGAASRDEENATNSAKRAQQQKRRRRFRTERAIGYVFIGKQPQKNQLKQIYHFRCDSGGD